MSYVLAVVGCLCVGRQAGGLESPTTARTRSNKDDDGTYRYTVTNTWVPNLTFESGPIQVLIPDDVTTSAKAMYNGIITSVRWRTDEAFATDEGNYTGMYLYDYDDKYQIKNASWAAPDFLLNSYVSEGNKFQLAGMEYDPNGNIKKLRRYNVDGVPTHNFSYHYKYQNEPSNQITPREFNNQLQSVEGYVNKYTYNKIGQMVGEDKSEGDENDQYVEYDVTGKVIKVFNKDTKLPADLKIENLYDDRGFRLAKINYVTQRTTWYIRDASGNVISVYEQEGVEAGQHQQTSQPLSQVELSIYGAGKLGTYYPLQDFSMNYEITDHLGNVRALLRDNIAAYTATMEDNGLEGNANPRNEEMAYFQNIEETVVTDVRMNNTKMIPGGDVPNQAAYLFWNDTQGTLADEKSIGPAIALKVQAGDILELEAWSRFERKNDYTHDFGLVALSALLGNTFAGSGGFEGYTLNNTISNLEGALTAGLFPDDGGEDGVPFAYLNYIIYDEEMVSQKVDWKQVPEGAGFHPNEIGLPEKKPVRVAFDGPITIEQSGYIYIWVSNQSKETRVWFDDLKVTHTQNIVVQATDYGVWGDVLREQKTDESVYRYGYQGQFAEKDEETGWNHFELREYDAVIGRWLVPDPYRQFFSSYLSMGNNPVNLYDKDGGCTGGDCPDPIITVNGDEVQNWYVDKLSELYAVRGTWGGVEKFIFELTDWSERGGYSYFGDGLHGQNLISSGTPGKAHGFINNPGISFNDAKSRFGTGLYKKFDDSFSFRMNAVSDLWSASELAKKLSTQTMSSNSSSQQVINVHNMPKSSVDTVFNGGWTAKDANSAGFYWRKQFRTVQSGDTSSLKHLSKNQWDKP